ncbi:MAG: VCBS repeat-containing protein, partial [Planctomycetes bacterium]|nr:VCBS repeat-containing protein [Planctomycetota bacterium]
MLVGEPDDGTLQFSEHLIMDGYAYSYGIAAADLDGDGDLDLTSADALPHNQLYWFENDGQGNFTRHLIEENYPERLERHAIGDINGDGHPDVVIVENLRGDLLWYQNSGKPRDDPVWKRHVITKGTIPGAYDV